MLTGADEITVSLLIKPLLFGAVIGAIFASVDAFETPRSGYLKRFFKSARYSIGFSLPVILLGFSSGYVTGASRSSVVGNLVPAVLTLVGGLTIYLFKEASINRQAIIACVVFAFAFSIFYGIQVGSFERQYTLFTRYQYLSDQERRIRDIRSNLELPSDPPNWITGVTKE